MSQLADRTKLVKPSVTLAIAAKAGKLRASGIDVINFSAGEPDFDTPEHIKAAAVEALRKGMTKYTDVKGIEPLREAISEKYHREHDLSYRKEDILVSCGAKHSLYNLLQAVVNPGDEVVIPAPYWVSYSDMALLAGGVPKLIPSDEASDFRITPQQIEASLTPRTRIFFLNSPCNPTGATYSRDELLALGQVLSAHGCLIIADDIYEKIVYDGFEVHNLVTLCPEFRERAVIVNGVSKTYAMTGWRIGYAVAGEPWMTGLAKATLYSSNGVSTPTQWAALAAFTTESDFLETSRAAYRERRDLLVGGLNELGLNCAPPAGAFYAFPEVTSISQDSREASEFLLDKARVATVPGVVFGPHGEGHVRFSFSTSIETIEGGLESLRRTL